MYQMNTVNQSQRNQNTREAYNRGVNAGRSQKPPENPYDYETDEENFTSWEEGYMNGFPNDKKITYTSKEN